MSGAILGQHKYEGYDGVDLNAGSQTPLYFNAITAEAWTGTAHGNAVFFALTPLGSATVHTAAAADFYIHGSSGTALNHNAPTAALDIKAKSTDSTVFKLQDSSGGTVVSVSTTAVTTGSALCINSSNVLTVCSSAVGAGGTCTCP